jgi:hypothetical protein
MVNRPTYVMTFQQHELDVVLDALRCYQAEQRVVHPRTADLAGALRRFLMKAQVEVYWEAERAMALPHLPPEST